MWSEREEQRYSNVPVITIGLPAELIKVPFPRKLPVAHQVLLKGFKGLTVFVTRFNSTDHAGWPLTEIGLCSLHELDAIVWLMELIIVPRIHGRTLYQI